MGKEQLWEQLQQSNKHFNSIQYLCRTIQKYHWAPPEALPSKNTMLYLRKMQKINVRNYESLGTTSTITLSLQYMVTYIQDYIQCKGRELWKQNTKDIGNKWKQKTILGIET